MLIYSCFLIFIIYCSLSKKKKREKKKDKDDMTQLAKSRFQVFVNRSYFPSWSTPNLFILLVSLLSSNKLFTLQLTNSQKACNVIDIYIYIYIVFPIKMSLYFDSRVGRIWIINIFIKNFKTPSGINWVTYITLEPYYQIIKRNKQLINSWIPIDLIVN